MHAAREGGSGATERAGRGHSSLPHTADVVIEAWGPSAGACYEEAVSAFTELFCDAGPVTEGSCRRVDLGPGSPEELLVLLLERALCEMDGSGELPVSASLELRGDRLSGWWKLVPADETVAVGAVPKGVSYHMLRFEAEGRRWRCRATIDV